MDSVEELHSRITKLDTEIELQRKLLLPVAKLERDKRLAQRQLNAALDPVERLPFEISSEILVLSRSTFPVRDKWSSPHTHAASQGGELAEGIISIIWGHGQQLKHLETREVLGHENYSITPISKLWGRTRPGPLPSLQTLTILDDVRGLGDVDGSEGLIFASNLRRLMFGERGKCPDPGGDEILTYVSLPRLEVLSVCQVYTHENLLGFLQCCYSE
ncbi:hypothetical protein B0H14DRAFT_3177785 [Mycena olivaceomarginata]|nr:hypothetical protein B0H14DRAFT_3177785 [Mycena olivaceomarginata]